MLAPPMPWECAPAPRVRIPGFDGSTVIFTAVLDPDGAAAGQNANGVDLALVTATTWLTFRRLPVGDAFPAQLVTFLNAAAAHLVSPESVESFFDEKSGITMSVVESNDFTVTLKVIVRRESDETDSRSEVEVLVPSTRAALITAAEEVRDFAERRESEEFPFLPAKPALPLDLLSTPSEKRLTGIYESGFRLSGEDDLVFVSHYIRLTRDAQGDVETSLLAAHLPLCEIAVHGVYADRQPWVLITQLLPVRAETDIEAPWDPIDVARQELNAALKYAATDLVLGEGVVTRSNLIESLVRKGVPENLISDWETGELARASIADIANIPLMDLAVGRLTGCAFPDIPHDCPKDVFSCAFSRWQERLFNPPEEAH